jgi:hypothetical protein
MRIAIVLTIALLAATPAAADSLFGKAKNLLGNVTGGGSASSVLSNDEIGAGLREALRIGSGNVVDQVSDTGGFEADPAIHIPLPKNLAKAQKMLKRLGMSNQLDDLEIQLNRAAEVASVKAKDMFVDAIQAMTLDDVREILGGPDDAATQFFRRQMSPGLKAEMKPVVDDSLARVGAIQTYEQTVGDFSKVPLVPNLKADLTDHVLEMGLDGIFHYLAVEEAAIRNNPAKRTTELLQKVFAN